MPANHNSELDIPKSINVVLSRKYAFQSLVNFLVGSIKSSQVFDFSRRNKVGPQNLRPNKLLDQKKTLQPYKPKNLQYYKFQAYKPRITVQSIGGCKAFKLSCSEIK